MSETTTVLIRKYGLLDPLDWGSDCQEQLLLQNKLWNCLVRIEREAQAHCRRILSADSDYAQLIAGLEGVDAEIADLWDRRRSQGHPVAASEIVVRIRTLIVQRRRLSQRERQLRAALRPRFVAPLLQADLERKAAVKRARQESGLWWGNYNAVCGAYERARIRALRTGATLRFRAFDGTGRFRNQIVGGMSVDDLFTGRHAQVCAAHLPGGAHAHPVRAERRRLSRTALTATIYTTARERRNLTWPMIMHRPIPAGARIKEIIVTRKREGDRFRWSAIFLCTQKHIASPPALASGAACVALTCHEEPDGVHVATVSDAEGHVEHVRLPEAVVKRATYIESLRKRAEHRLSDMQTRVTSWLATATFPPELDALARQAAHAWSSTPLTNLALAWRGHPGFRADWREDIESWRRTDKREHIEASNLQRKLLGLRRQHYQCEAKRLAERYGAITLTTLELEATRSLRRLVAVSELVTWLQTQCAKTGTHMETSAYRSTHVVDMLDAQA
ncbi:MAG: hypothetical protein WDO68_21960 [Gammaproteobacteria bacterium]